MAREDGRFDDERLGQELRDAYGRLELSGEAQDRMLTELRAAQRERGMAMGSQTQAKESAGQRDARPQAPAEAGRPARVRWLPMAAAAAIVTALVVVGVGWFGDAHKASESAAPEASVAETAPVAERTQDGYAADAAREAPESGVALQDEGVKNLVDYCPYITLESGERLTAYSDGQWFVEVDASQVGELVGEAAATAADAQSETGPVGCKVYRFLDEEDGYVVQYDSEQSYWRCYPM